MLKSVPVASLVEDVDFYPRSTVSDTRIAAMVDHLETGGELPPVVVDTKMRIVDGLHRVRAHKRLKRETITADVRKYQSDAALFAEAVRLNTGHGLPLNPYDVKRSVSRLRELGVELDAISDIVRMPVPRLEEMFKGFAQGSAGPVPLKAGLGHLAGQRVTARQRKAITRVSGMNAVWHVNQLIEIIDGGIAPPGERFAEAMDRLIALWESSRVK